MKRRKRLLNCSILDLISIENTYYGKVIRTQNAFTQKGFTVLLPVIRMDLSCCFNVGFYGGGGFGP